ncbi:MAG: hypothetical protein GW949_09910 [Spirochaetales bacterium]|nr:hypothetical protein [Spirochaetales bacterium]
MSYGEGVIDTSRLRQAGRWIGLSLLSGGLYIFGFTFGLFLLPLQFVFERYEKHEKLYSLGLIGLVLIAYRLLQGGGVSLGLLTLFESFGMMGVVSVMEWGKGLKTDLRLALAFVLGALVSAPFVYFLSTDVEIREGLVELLGVVFAQSELLVDWNDITETLLHMMIRTYGFGVFFAGMLVVFIGKMWSGTSYRSLWRKSLSIYSVRTGGVWVLIAGWTVALLDARFSLSVLGIVGWNVALMAGSIYSLQGLGIIQAFFSGRGRDRSAPIGLIVFSLFIPGINGIVALGLPLLGVAETWVEFKSRKKESQE